MYQLYGYWRSSASWRLRWALEVKGHDYKYHPVNLLKGEHKSPEHLKLNPSGKVPVLKTLNETVLTQSMAQLEFLEETSTNTPLLPSNALERAQCRALCEIINADTAPFQTPFAQKRHSSDDGEKLKWAQEWISKGLTAFDELSSQKGQFSMGDSLSMADLFLVPQIYNAIRYELDVEKTWPQLHQIYLNCLALPECQKSAPENQSDAPKS